MRLVLRLLFYAAAIAALWWLLQQITASFNRATHLASTADASRAYGMFAAYLIAGAVLAVVLARDLAQFLGGLAGKLFWSGGRVAAITPAWWKAERLCKEQKPVEAAKVLRNHLDAHPRHWPAAVRIAEIYQHEVRDPLASALEYEELLQRRLPRSVRAKILLRLATCQIELRNGEAAAATLREVIKQFPKSSAAKTASRRLARLENPSA